MTPDLILNIGLDVADGQRLTLDRVHEAVKARFPDARIAIELHQSDTEPTAVVSLTGTETGSRARNLMNLSTDLHQDCIAWVFTPRGTSGLIGPRADKWLPFDASKFIMPGAVAVVRPFGQPRHPAQDFSDKRPFTLAPGGVNFTTEEEAADAKRGAQTEIDVMVATAKLRRSIDWRAEAQRLVDALAADGFDGYGENTDQALRDFEALKLAVDRG